MYVRGSTAVRCLLYQRPGQEGLRGEERSAIAVPPAVAEEPVEVGDASLNGVAAVNDTGAATPLLRSDNLTRHFRIGGLLSGRTLHAVENIDLSIARGEIVALVGESGSGKSTVARLLREGFTHQLQGKSCSMESP